MRRYLNSLKRIKSPIKFWDGYYRLKRKEEGFIQSIDFYNGFHFEVPHQLKTAFDEIYLRGVYDQGLALIGSGSTVLDLGGNAGYFSLAVFMRSQKIRLIAAEPLPVNVNLYKESMAMNNIDNYTLLEKAVMTNDSGVLGIHYESDDSASVGASMIERQKSKKVIQVPTITLDEIYEQQNLQKVDLLKIDCEGAEYNILFNASDEVFEKTPNIILETHAWAPKEEGTIPQLEEFLKKKGYHTRIIHSDILFAQR